MEAFEGIALSLIQLENFTSATVITDNVSFTGERVSSYQVVSTGYIEVHVKLFRYRKASSKVGHSLQELIVPKKVCIES